jgi:hypothetical protein
MVFHYHVQDVEEKVKHLVLIERFEELFFMLILFVRKNCSNYVFYVRLKTLINRLYDYIVILRYNE